jgi:hypothetical protein
MAAPKLRLAILTLNAVGTPRLICGRCTRIGTLSRSEEIMRKAAVCLFVLVFATFALAQQDKSKRPSPPGTAEVTLNGKKITIDYSRPHTRDPKTGEQRKMIGDHEPYGQVWRAGANEATSLNTEGDIQIGGTAVPAGSYTLFVLPEQGKMTLIISKKTGEWGIPYPGEEFDLARIPMKFTSGNAPVEQFTISFDKTSDNSARLALAWEDWKALVPVTAK